MHITQLRSLALLVAASVAVSVSPALAHAQGSARDTLGSGRGSVPDTARRNLFLVNPFGIVFNVYSVEYERVIARSTSIGLAGTYYKPNDFTYFTSEVKLRYYPSERAPDGFSVALSGGVTHETADIFCFDTCDFRATDRPTLGFELDYNWLLGPSRRFAIGTGIGAKRFFGSHPYATLDGIPTARIVLGVAF